MSRFSRVEGVLRMNPSKPSAEAIESVDFAAAISAVELDWFAENDVVRVIPRHQRRFEIQKDRAIEILQQAKEGERFEKQFDLLLEQLAEWISSREHQILSAIVTLQDGTLTFIAVRREARYDEQFQDDLADLDFAIANDPDLNLIRLKTLALPCVTSDALGSFLDERLIFSYHGKGSGPHPSG